MDHPATQAWKRQRLAEAELALPPWLTFVSVEFEQDDLQQKLSSAGFQRTSAVFFTWLGVVPYLTQDAIGSTLDYMASIRNSEVVFDYTEPHEASSKEIRGVVKERTEQLEKTEERWPAVSSRPALRRFFARTDFATSKIRVSSRSHPGSVVTFKGSRRDSSEFVSSM